jgi:hypothetical protein
MQAMRFLARFLAIAFGAGVLAGCSNDEECIRRYLNEPREKWCHGERTMNDELYEPHEAAR